MRGRFVIFVALAAVASSIFVSAILISAVSGQSRSTREATYALRGPVRTMRVEEAHVVTKNGAFVEGPRILLMTVLFNEDGSRPELCLYNDKGLLTRRIEMKFEGGRDVEFLNYDGGGRMWLRGVTLYDRDGRVKEKATYNGDGSLRSRTTYKRNAKGAIVEWAEADAKGNVLDKFVNTFDDAGQLKTSERTMYRPDGSVSVKEFSNIPAKRVESVSYNPDGSIARSSVRADALINEFGPDGSLVKTTQINYPDRLTNQSVHNADGSVTKQSPIANEVDSHGNWIKQTQWISDAQGTRPVKVAYRVITYF